MVLGEKLMKKAFLPLLTLLFSMALSWGQEISMLSTDRTVPPPPVISELRADLAGNSVILSWKAAPEVKGESIILRYNNPITAANYLSSEKRGVVPHDVTTFTDTIDDGQQYYYAVLSREDNGTLYDFFLPANNSMLLGVSSAEPSAPEGIAEITGLDPMVRNDAIILTWQNPLKGRNLVLYRSTNPFTGMTSLAQAVVISNFADSGAPFVDYPVPGVPCFYALLDEGAIRSGNATFVPGGNTNRVPVEVPANFAKYQKSGLPSVRPMPLPWLNPSREPQRQEWRFAKETEAMIRKMAPPVQASKAVAHEPYVFVMDIESTGSGEEYALKTIIETQFIGAKWQKAAGDLDKFLSIRRTPKTTARARFYLGQAHFFSGNYRQALLDFLLAQNQYYSLSREWVQYTMERLEASGANP